MKCQIFCGVMNSIRDTSLHNDLNLEEVPIKNVAKSAFLLKVRPPIRYAIVHAVMLSKKHQRSSAVQKEERLTIEGRHHLLLLHKQAHTKKTLQNHCTST